MVAHYISAHSGINVVEPSQSPWFSLRSVSKTLCTRATFEIIIKHIERQNGLFSDCADVISKKMTDGLSAAQAHLLEQQSNHLYTIRRRSEMLDTAAVRFKRRQSLLAQSRFDGISDSDRSAFLNAEELSNLLILTTRVTVSIENFKNSLHGQERLDYWSRAAPFPQLAPFRPAPPQFIPPPIPFGGPAPGGFHPYGPDFDDTGFRAPARGGGGFGTAPANPFGGPQHEGPFGGGQHARPRFGWPDDEQGPFEFRDDLDQDEQDPFGFGGNGQRGLRNPGAPPGPFTRLPH